MNVLPMLSETHPAWPGIRVVQSRFLCQTPDYPPNASKSIQVIPLVLIKTLVPPSASFHQLNLQTPHSTYISVLVCFHTEAYTSTTSSLQSLVHLPD